MSQINIVILHGWGHDKSYWTQIQDSFLELGNVIALDLPGFGAQPLIADDWGIPDYAGWVMHEINAKNLINVVLLGHSFGGRIASYIASQRPTWLKGLILYGSPSLYRPSPKVRAKIRIAKVVKNFGHKGNLDPESDLAIADKSGLGLIFRKVVNFDQTKELSNISVPTLLVWGQNDKEVPMEIAREMQKLIKDSKLVILDNLGHNAHLDKPHLFHGTVKSFIQSL